MAVDGCRLPKRDVVRSYLNFFQKSVHSRKRASGSISISLRKNEGGHFPQNLQQQLRCRVCHQKARYECIKCKITLCLEREHITHLSI